jgi:hypothetical protein
MKQSLPEDLYFLLVATFHPFIEFIDMQAKLCHVISVHVFASANLEAQNWAEACNITRRMTTVHPPSFVS